MPPLRIGGAGTPGGVIVWLGTSFYTLAFASAAIFFFAPAFAQAADLNFSPTSGSHAVGETFSVTVLISPGTDSVNAADGTVTYDKDLLSLASFSKDGSVFSLWTAEPTISATDGTLVFSGGTPTAFSTDGTILTLKFKALKTGAAKLSFTKGSVLAADGKGTDVYVNGGTASFTITDAAPAPAPAPADASTTDASAADTSTADATAVDTGPPPPPPAIDSPTFPKEDQWYATSTGMFTWKLLADVTGVRVLLSDSDSATPTQDLKADATSSLQSDIKDGTSYFYAQFKNQSGWGDVGKRKIQIDTVPPSDFDITVDSGGADGVPKLAFKADDALSGIDHYQLLLGSTSVATIAAKDISDGTYPVPPQAGGTQTVTVRAYDLAGNLREVKKDLNLPKVDKPTPKDGATGTPAPSGPSILDRIIEIALALTVGALAAWIHYSKKTAEQNRLGLLKRMAEVSDKSDRVFSAMREEFEQMINDFDKRPQLTPEERALLEDMKEVLEISEELINSGMDDLKKMVRGVV